LEKEAATALLQLARPAVTQHDSVTPATTGALQSAPGDTHTPVTSADGHAQLPPTTVDSVTPASAGTLTSADSHTQPPPLPTTDSVTHPTAGALV